MADTPKLNTPKEDAPKESDIPREPTPEELPIVAVTPGWQQKSKPVIVKPRVCIHMGRIPASLNLPWQKEGDEWICTCGQLFRVEINAGDKKVLRKQEGMVANVSEAPVARNQFVSPEENLDQIVPFP